MPDKNQEEELFEQFANAVDPAESSGFRAPARLKARIYSALMLRESAESRLRSIPEVKTAGHGLCVFEELMRIAPVGEKLKSLNICRVCHARLLGEIMENPPIYWESCPYVSFKASSAISVG